MDSLRVVWFVSLVAVVSAESDTAERRSEWMDGALGPYDEVERRAPAARGERGEWTRLSHSLESE